MHPLLVKAVLQFSLSVPEFLAIKLFSLFGPPAELPDKKTYVYKTVGETEIHADVYLGVNTELGKRPIMLYIHGGGWTGGNRTEYNRPMFLEFLQRGFVVVTIDYRLLPESAFVEDQLEDVADIETWIRDGSLQEQLKAEDVWINSATIIVCGASAGGLLALLTPKLWKTSPVSIFIMYAPTNLTYLRYQNRGLLAGITVPPLTKDLIKALYESHLPTALPAPNSAQDFFKPRGLLGMNLYRAELITEFLLRRFPNGQLPEKGCVPKEEMEAFSPFFLCAKVKYPPVVHVMGSVDEVFDTITQVEKFDAELKKHNVPSQSIIVPGVGHSWDMRSVVGDKTHIEVVKPAVDWVCQHLKYVQASSENM